MSFMSTDDSATGSAEQARSEFIRVIRQDGKLAYGPQALEGGTPIWTIYESGEVYNMDSSNKQNIKDIANEELKSLMITPHDEPSTSTERRRSVFDSPSTSRTREINSSPMYMTITGAGNSTEPLSVNDYLEVIKGNTFSNEDTSRVIKAVAREASMVGISGSHSVELVLRDNNSKQSALMSVVKIAPWIGIKIMPDTVRIIRDHFDTALLLSLKAHEFANKAVETITESGVLNDMEINQWMSSEEFKCRFDLFQGLTIEFYKGINASKQILQERKNTKLVIELNKDLNNNIEFDDTHALIKETIVNRLHALIQFQAPYIMSKYMTATEGLQQGLQTTYAAYEQVTLLLDGERKTQAQKNIEILKMAADSMLENQLFPTVTIGGMGVNVSVQSNIDLDISARHKMNRDMLRNVNAYMHTRTYGAAPPGSFDNISDETVLFFNRHPNVLLVIVYIGNSKYNLQAHTDMYMGTKPTTKGFGALINISTERLKIKDFPINLDKLRASKSINCKKYMIDDEGYMKEYEKTRRSDRFYYGKVSDNKVKAISTDKEKAFSTIMSKAKSMGGCWQMLETGTTRLAISGEMGYRKMTIAEAATGLSAHFGDGDKDELPHKQLTWMRVEGLNVKLEINDSKSEQDTYNINTLTFGGVTLGKGTTERHCRNVEIIASHKCYYWDNYVTWGNMDR